jgi:uncharacterized protein
MKTSAGPIPYLVPAGTIPPGGRHFSIEANDAQRARIAEALKIAEVTSLSAELDVRQMGHGVFGVRGGVKATVVQQDVVTLDQVKQEVAEEIDLTLRPADERARGPAAEAIADSAAEDATDVYQKGQLDLGQIVVEHLALGLDPYPRAEGSVFQGYVEDDPKDDPSPFAALKALKQPPE